MKIRVVASFVAALSLSALAPVAAQASFTVGSSLRQRADLFTRCDAYCTELQTTKPGGLPGAQIPYDGVLTRWRVRAATNGTVRLRVLRPQADGTYLGVGASLPTALGQPHEPGRDSLYEFTARITVQAGDVLALDRDRRAGGLFHGYATDASYVAATFSPALGDLAAAPGASAIGRQLLLNADIERDADGDGFGDESQDNCPSIANDQTSNPCPPVQREPGEVQPGTGVTPLPPGTEGPTVEGEGGPSRTTSSSSSAHSEGATARPDPARPVDATSSHREGASARPAPSRRGATTTQGHGSGASARPAPSRASRQQSEAHAGRPAQRPAPSRGSGQQSSGHARPSTRPAPSRPKRTPSKAHDARPGARPAPQRPATPGFRPH